MAIKNFPKCIYFDTNIIRKIGITNHGTPFMELKELTEMLKIPIVLPDCVWMEWLNDFNKKIIKEEEQTKYNLRDFELLLGLKQKEFMLPDDYADKLIITIREKLKAMDIVVVATPENISLKDLVAMAAFKIKPFEEKHEKGFRDTIILYTILEDMKNRKIKDGLYVTSDNVYSHEDVLKIIEKYRVNLKIVSSLEEASIHIKNAVTKDVKKSIELKKQKLMDFVETKSTEVFDFVKKEAELTETFITKGSFLSEKQDIYGQVERVSELELVEIESVYEASESPSEPPPPKNNEWISISVKVRLKVEYLPLAIFNKPGVKIQDLSKFREVVDSIPTPFFGQPTETELMRNIVVYALAVKAESGDYVDLILKKVSTF